MPKYRVRTKIVQVFSCVVEAPTPMAAADIAFDLTSDLVPTDCYWHDSNTELVPDDTETDD